MKCSLFHHPKGSYITDFMPNNTEKQIIQVSEEIMISNKCLWKANDYVQLHGISSSSNFLLIWTAIIRVYNISFSKIRTRDPYEFRNEEHNSESVPIIDPIWCNPFNRKCDGRISFLVYRAVYLLIARYCF